MTDNTQELDVMLDHLMQYSYDYGSGNIPTSEDPPLLIARQAKQAILDWHNKQVAKAKELNFITYIKNNRVQALDADHISITDSGISFGKTNPLFERVVIEYDKEEKAIRFRKPSDGEYGISYKVGVNPATGAYGFRARPFIGVLPAGYYIKIAKDTYRLTTHKERQEDGE